jgi:ABC-type oligopeptide transport system substrate-binding subunit
MKQISRTLILVSILVIAVLQLSACSDTSSQAAGDEAPATVEPIKGTDKSSVTLSAQAAKRLDIKTAAIRRSASGAKVIPYDAVQYDADGKTFTYTSPERLVFVREPISVARIDGNRAILSAGPAAGTEVVTVGSQELYGSEYEVEED